jgi:hypothetical protein
MTKISSTDLSSNYQRVSKDQVQLSQDGFETQSYTKAQLEQALSSETDFARALALQEALDLLAAPEPRCVCLERIGDNGYCPVHGRGFGG